MLIKKKLIKKCLLQPEFLYQTIDEFKEFIEWFEGIRKHSEKQYHPEIVTCSLKLFSHKDKILFFPKTITYFVKSWKEIEDDLKPSAIKIEKNFDIVKELFRLQAIDHKEALEYIARTSEELNLETSKQEQTVSEQALQNTQIPEQTSLWMSVARVLQQTKESSEFLDNFAKLETFKEDVVSKALGHIEIYIRECKKADEFFNNSHSSTSCFVDCIKEAESAKQELSAIAPDATAEETSFQVASNSDFDETKSELAGDNPDLDGADA